MLTRVLLSIASTLSRLLLYSSLTTWNFNSRHYAVITYLRLNSFLMKLSWINNLYSLSHYNSLVKIINSFINYSCWVCVNCTHKYRSLKSVVEPERQILVTFHGNFRAFARKLLSCRKKYFLDIDFFEMSVPDTKC